MKHLLLLIPLCWVLTIDKYDYTPVECTDYDDMTWQAVPAVELPDTCPEKEICCLGIPASWPTNRIMRRNNHAHGPLP